MDKKEEKIDVGFQEVDAREAAHLFTHSYTSKYTEVCTKVIDWATKKGKNKKALIFRASKDMRPKDVSNLRVAVAKALVRAGLLKLQVMTNTKKGIVGVMKKKNRR